MDVYEAIVARKSVRAFKDKDVSEEMVVRLLEAARLAPSASNRQEWRFVVVRDPLMKKHLSAAARGQEFIGAASVVLACCAETDERVMACGQLCYPIDVAIALTISLSVQVPKGSVPAGLGHLMRIRSKSCSVSHRRYVCWSAAYQLCTDPSTVEKKRLLLEEIITYERW